MPADFHDLLQQLLHACHPTISLTTPEEASDLRFFGAEHIRTPRYLISKKHKLWTSKQHNYCCGFVVPELNFDSLAQCHMAALELGTARFDPAAKHSTTCITAVILCQTAQADALETLARFKKSAGRPLSPKARLEYRLIAVDSASGEMACNRRARKISSALRTQFPLIFSRDRRYQPT